MKERSMSRGPSPRNDKAAPGWEPGSGPKTKSTRPNLRPESLPAEPPAPTPAGTRAAKAALLERCAAILKDSRATGETPADHTLKEGLRVLFEREARYLRRDRRPDAMQEARRLFSLASADTLASVGGLNA